MNVFRKMKLDIYHPKKDQCNKCVMHRNKNLSEDYQEHCKKNEAQKEKKDKTEITTASKTGILCYTVDLQALLLSP